MGRVMRTQGWLRWVEGGGRRACSSIVGWCSNRWLRAPVVQNMVLEGGKLMAHKSLTAVDGIDGVVELLVLRLEGFILGLEAIDGCLKSCEVVCCNGV